MRFSTAARSRRARIDMIPLMDSMFLLLVFFIYAMLSMQVHQGISVTLPQAVTATVSQQSYTAVSVTASGDIFVNKQRIDLKGLIAYLSGIREQGKDPDIYINADVRAEYGGIISILDALREQGFNKVSFETSADAEHD